MHIDNPGSIRVGFFQLVHQYSDFNDLSGVAIGTAEQRAGFIERQRCLASAAARSQTFSGQINENVPHGKTRQRKEMSAISNLPTAPRKAPNPKFADEFGFRERRHIALSLERPQSNLSQLRHYFAQQGLGNFGVAPHKELQPFREGSLHRHVPAILPHPAGHTGGASWACKPAAWVYNGPMFSRRSLLKSAALTLPAAHLFGRQLRAIGVQLYTVRNVLPQKPEETLRAIEAIGYQEIEATYGGLDRIWPAIRGTRLNPVSVHLDNTLMNAGKEDELARAIDQAKKWGFAYAVFPYVPPNERGGLDKFRELSDKLNRAGEKCRAAGLRFCYHNHAFEFQPMEGTTGFQTMIERLDPKLCAFEMDCFWVSVAGHDPVELLSRLSGRVALLHLKDKAEGTAVRYNESVDRGAFKEVGHGTLNWPAILRAAESAGVQRYFVEQDQTPGDPIDSLRQSFAYLSKLQY